MKKFFWGALFILTFSFSSPAQTSLELPPVSDSLPQAAAATTQEAAGEDDLVAERQSLSSHLSGGKLIRFVADSDAGSEQAAPPLELERNAIYRPASTVADDARGKLPDVEGFHWKRALKQSLLFLAVQHGYALTQPKTRRDLKGRFWKDYFESVGSLGKWDDGGRFFTNYVAHPMQGALMGFVQVQNDPRGINAQFGTSKAYWVSRMKAMAWSAAFSTQFEIGPVSQASIGNVGKHGKQTYVDLVITPTGGTLWLIAEDALDRFVVRRLEQKTDNFYARITLRLLLNPVRSSANLLRFKKPWHRDF